MLPIRCQKGHRSGHPVGSAEPPERSFATSASRAVCDRAPRLLDHLGATTLTVMLREAILECHGPANPINLAFEAAYPPAPAAALPDHRADADDARCADESSA